MTSLTSRSLAAAKGFDNGRTANAANRLVRLRFRLRFDVAAIGEN